MAKPKLISEEDFSAWKDNAITQTVFAYLRQKEAEAHRYWAAYLTGDNNIDPVAVLVWRAELRSKLEFIDDLTTIELADIQEEEDAGNPTDERVRSFPRRRQA